jgi:hypothetical protein
MATAILQSFGKQHLIAAVLFGAVAMQASAAHTQPDKLLGGETLTAGESISAPSGVVRLVMQSDGNLVLYRQADGAPLWNSQTWNNPGAYAALASNGNLSVIGPGSQVLFQTNTPNNPGAKLLTQSDSNLVLYSTSTVRWTPLWHTSTGVGLYTTPAYEPAYWNDASTAQYNNNCYNYSNNRRTDTFAQPGRAAGYTGYPMEVTAVRNGAIADGLEPTTATAAAPQGKTRIALVIWQGVDYHWYRQDRNGRWTHKPGGTKATNVDNSGAVITNPETANRGGYTQFGGYFFTPSSEIQGQGHAVIN